MAISYSDQNRGLATILNSDKYLQRALDREDKEDHKKAVRAANEAKARADAAKELERVKVQNGEIWNDPMAEAVSAKLMGLEQILHDPSVDPSQISQEVNKAVNQIEYDYNTARNESAKAGNLIEASEKDKRYKQDAVSDFVYGNVFKTDEEGFVTDENGNRVPKDVSTVRLPNDVNELVQKPGGSAYINMPVALFEALNNTYKAGSTTINRETELPETASSTLRQFNGLPVFGMNSAGEIEVNLEKVPDDMRAKIKALYDEHAMTKRNTLEGYVTDEIYNTVKEDPFVARGMSDYVAQRKEEVGKEKFSSDEIEYFSREYLTNQLQGLKQGDTRMDNSYEKKDPKEEDAFSWANGSWGFGRGKDRIHVAAVKVAGSPIRTVGKTVKGKQTEITAVEADGTVRKIDGRDMGPITEVTNMEEVDVNSSKGMTIGFDKQIPFALKLGDGDEIATDFKVTNIHIGSKGDIWARGFYATEEKSSNALPSVLAGGDAAPEKIKKTGQETEYVKLDPEGQASLAAMFGVNNMRDIALMLDENGQFKSLLTGDKEETEEETKEAVNLGGFF